MSKIEWKAKVYVIDPHSASVSQFVAALIELGDESFSNIARDKKISASNDSFFMAFVMQLL